MQKYTLNPILGNTIKKQTAWRASLLHFKNKYRCEKQCSNNLLTMH